MGPLWDDQRYVNHKKIGFPQENDPNKKFNTKNFIFLKLIFHDRKTAEISDFDAHEKNIEFLTKKFSQKYHITLYYIRTDF